MVKEQGNDGVNLLVSILVRYPEISSLNIIPTSQTLKITFLLSRIISAAEFNAVRQRLSKSIEAFNMLEGRSDIQLQIEQSTYEHITLLTVARDMPSLSQEEIALLIATLQEQFGDALVTDSHEPVVDEELAVQEEMIQSMLDNVRVQNTKRRLIAIREEGRVMVFDK